MKRKLAALACALILLAQLVPAPARAAGGVYFTAVNETLLEVSDATMPFWSGGYLFVPASVFSNRELGVSFSYNSQKKTAAIWSVSQPGNALIFDLRNDLVWDGSRENNYSPTAILRSSGLFVAVSMVAGYFGLSYTNTKVSHGYLVRIRSSASVLTDADFIDAGASLLLSRYSQYVKSKTDTGGTGGAAGGEVAAPGETAPETGEKNITLCIRADDSSAVTALLDALDGSAYVTFYAREDFLRRNGDLLRRITASGHGVGLIADAAAGSAEEQLRAANEALWAATGGKTRLCLPENAGEDALAELEQAGWCCLRPDADRAGKGLRSAVSARALLASLKKGASIVWVSDNVTADGLEAFRSAAGKENDRLTAMTETAQAPKWGTDR